MQQIIESKLDPKRPTGKEIYLVHNHDHDHHDHEQDQNIDQETQRLEELDPLQ